MNSTNSSYNAEDFLSGRVPDDEQHLVSKGEMEIAESVQAVLKNSGNEKIPPLEAARLWDRIEKETVGKKKWITWKLIVRAAAVLLMLSGIGIWQYNANTPSHKLLAFAAQNVGKSSVSSVPNSSSAPTGTSSPTNDGENIISANDFNTLIVGNANRSAVELPDGTKAWLNSGSRLIYPVNFTGDTREVFLEGEAYFDVAHDKAHPFLVHADHMAIKVLGTEFFVSARADSASNYTILLKGSIAFSTGNWLSRTEKTLVPGEQLSFNHQTNSLVLSHADTTDFRSWKEGYIEIHNEPLSAIVQRISKYYNITINTDGLDLSDTFSGTLVFQRSAIEVLNALLGAKYSYNSTERRLELRKP